MPITAFYRMNHYSVRSINKKKIKKVRKRMKELPSTSVQVNPKKNRLIKYLECGRYDLWLQLRRWPNDFEQDTLNRRQRGQGDLSHISFPLAFKKTNYTRVHSISDKRRENMSHASNWLWSKESQKYPIHQYQRENRLWRTGRHESYLCLPLTCRFPKG